jgi:hypothetical protein
MSDKRNLPVTTTPAQRNALQNSGTRVNNIVDHALSNLTQDEIAEVRREILKEKVRLELNERERLLQYEGAKESVELHIQAVKALEQGSKLSGQKITSDNIKTGAGNLRIESKTGATCFVATAAYGDPDHEDVVFLRQYRNNTLKKTVLGRAFIATYWKVGPVLAKPVKANAGLQRIIRRLLGSVVVWLRSKGGR